MGNDLDTIRRAADLGVTRVMVGYRGTGRPTADTYVDFIQRFGDEVIAAM